MRATAVLFLLAFGVVSASFAQSTAPGVLTIPPEQCVWHAGDDLSWAAPSFDDSTWQNFSQWKSTLGQPHLWVRCHTDLGSLRSAEHPAIQVTLFSAYQLFLDGVRIGEAGTLQNGNTSLNGIRSYALPSNLLPTGSPTTVTLRITDRSSAAGVNFFRDLVTVPLQLRAGEELILDALRARTAIARASPFATLAVCYGAIGIVAITLLGLFLFDRSRYELLIVSIYCLTYTANRLNDLSAAALFNFSVSTGLLIAFASNLGGLLLTPFFFALARRRIPAAYWILLAVGFVLVLPIGIDALTAANEPAWMPYTTSQSLVPLRAITQIALPILAVYLAFWPFSGLARRIRPIVAMCILLAAVEVVWWSVLFSARYIPALAEWRIAILQARGYTAAGVLIALFALLFREQQQTARERAVFAGELRAAGEIQRMLAPAHIDCAPGLDINVAFYPMSDVGGDFYLSRILPDGRQRLLLGDVSGKGTAAAMTASHLLGGAAARDADSPAELLAHLNRVFAESRVDGCATCICADFAPNGDVHLANAGHLAPYLGGQEMAISSGLPLGLHPQNGSYDVVSFTLSPGDTLMFLSDGVVEARNTTGELFGFDRTRSLSDRSADQIASAAKSFGQEDDITVLTLSFVPVGVVQV